jgi:hypothetical protein
MSADKAGELATDNGTRKQERLGTITVAAESIESDCSRIDHHRSELGSVGPILQQSQKNRAADEGEEQQSKNREARERDVLSGETWVLPIARVIRGTNTGADLREHRENYKLKLNCC